MEGRKLGWGGPKTKSKFSKVKVIKEKDQVQLIFCEAGSGVNLFAFVSYFYSYLKIKVYKSRV